MCINGYNSESIRMILTLEVDSTDIYRNLAIEGIVMICNQYDDNPFMMLDKFKLHLSPEDQTKLDSMAGKVVEDWKEGKVRSLKTPN